MCKIPTSWTSDKSDVNNRDENPLVANRIELVSDSLTDKLDGFPELPLATKNHELNIHPIHCTEEMKNIKVWRK